MQYQTSLIRRSLSHSLIFAVPFRLRVNETEALDRAPYTWPSERRDGNSTYLQAPIKPTHLYRPLVGVRIHERVIVNNIYLRRRHSTGISGYAVKEGLQPA